MMPWLVHQSLLFVHVIMLSCYHVIIYHRSSYLTAGKLCTFPLKVFKLAEELDGTNALAEVETVAAIANNAIVFFIVNTIFLFDNTMLLLLLLLLLLLVPVLLLMSWIVGLLLDTYSYQYQYQYQYQVLVPT